VFNHPLLIPGAVCSALAVILGFLLALLVI
jgi:anaerobic C4-dicarboxylate transporter